MTLIVPEYLQTKKYSAKRDRLTLAHGGSVQAGVWDANDYKVIQRAAGANMSVDVGAGFALVPANNTGNKGLYHIENDASVNVSLAASNATNPRIDMIYVQVDDSADGAAADDTPQFGVVTGTPTAGATLDNRTGAGTLPSNSLLLADVLVGAAVTSITGSNIRDRRPWVRGAFGFREYASNIDVTSTSAVALPGASFTQRVEVGANGLLSVEFAGSVVELLTGTAPSLTLQITIDGTAVQDGLFNGTGTVAGTYDSPFVSIIAAVSPGSHLVDVRGSVNTGSMRIYGSVARHTQLRMLEILQPNANNGTA